MSRLIDADKLVLHLNDYALQEAPFGRNDGKNQKEIYDTIQECMKAVEEQPTAFDVENVVSNLEQLELDGACNNENCVNCRYYGDCVAGEKREELALDKAIEILKRGGLDES
ncbi:hypothetical protein [Coprococcus comes]|uniref:hypothetical protein n=1 Tax=Coprococcus comes TaxID=410072 RepID=UPI00319DA8E7